MPEEGLEPTLPEGKRILNRYGLYKDAPFGPIELGALADFQKGTFLLQPNINKGKQSNPNPYQVSGCRDLCKVCLGKSYRGNRMSTHFPYREDRCRA